MTLCRGCRVKPRLFDRVVSALAYEGVSKELILAFKFKERLSLQRFLGKILAEAIRQRLGSDPADLLLPVPLHPTRKRERGFNQADLLARSLSETLGLPCRTDVLRRVRYTPSQASLTRHKRLTNVRGAFQVHRATSITGLRILLIDDVYTTGATADQCVLRLKRAGAIQVVVATVAHG